MVKCSACSKYMAAKDGITCKGCTLKYHRVCVALPESVVVAPSWVCPACRAKTPRQLHSADPPCKGSLEDGAAGSEIPALLRGDPCLGIGGTTGGENMDLATRSRVASPALGEAPVTMDGISTLLDHKLNIALSNFMSSFRTAIIEDIRASIKNELLHEFQAVKDDMTKTTDKIRAEQQTLKALIEEKATIIEKLELENTSLQIGLKQLGNRLSMIEKISRSCNVEVQAVPEAHNENVLTLFNRMCDVVGSPIAEPSILACRRVAKVNASSSRPRNILVSLASPRLRDEVLSAVYRYNKSHTRDKINTSHLGLSGETRRVFINEHLSPEQKALHAATRIAAKAKNFKYVWVKYGRIYVRKDETSKATLISNEDALSKLH